MAQSKADLELTETLLLLPKCWVFKGIHHHTWLGMIIKGLLQLHNKFEVILGLYETLFQIANKRK